MGSDPYFTWKPRTAGETASPGEPQYMEDGNTLDYLRIQKSMQITIVPPFSESNVSNILKPSGKSSTLISHVSSFVETIDACKRHAPLGFHNLVAAIPTLPPPPTSIITTPNGRCPGWSTRDVFASHLDIYGNNVVCDPIYNRIN